MRSVKDTDEIRSIERASCIADETMEELTRFIKAGVTKRAIKKRILELFGELGSEDVSFDLIVGTGINGTISHYTGDDGIVQAGDFVKIDIGCKHGGYCSDTARTFCVGEATEEQRRIYEHRSGSAGRRRGCGQARRSRPGPRPSLPQGHP